MFAHGKKCDEVIFFLGVCFFLENKTTNGLHRLGINGVIDWGTKE